MQVLCNKDVIALTELLLEDLPRTILKLICNSPNITEGAIIGIIYKTFPSIIPFDKIRENCIMSIHWFLHNGDIAISGNHRYVVLPPYFVVQENDKKINRIKLCGDPRLDSKIDGILRSKGCNMEEKYVSWHLETDFEQKVQNVGLQRSCFLSSTALIKNLSHEFGIPIIYPKIFEENLPSIKTLPFPPRSHFNATAPVWGFWDTYIPEHREEERWKEIKNWAIENCTILRWLPSRDKRGQYGIRYFLHNGHKHLSELNCLYASLWLFRLDYKHRCPRKLWINEQSIFTPDNIPDSHKHWLQLISINWCRTKQFIKYKLACEPKKILDRLHETLGLQIVSGQPNIK